jgi:hypothetical protein
MFGGRPAFSKSPWRLHVIASASNSIPLMIRGGLQPMELCCLGKKINCKIFAANYSMHLLHFSTENPFSIKQKNISIAIKISTMATK